MTEILKEMLYGVLTITPLGLMLARRIKIYRAYGRTSIHQRLNLAIAVMLTAMVGIGAGGFTWTVVWGFLLLALCASIGFFIAIPASGPSSDTTRK